MPRFSTSERVTRKGCSLFFCSGRNWRGYTPQGWGVGGVRLGPRGYPDLYLPCFGNLTIFCFSFLGCFVGVCITNAHLATWPERKALLPVCRTNTHLATCQVPLENFPMYYDCPSCFVCAEIGSIIFSFRIREDCLSL